MTEHVGAASYERSARRTDYRNGHKRRTLRTRVGTLNLLVPKDLKKEPSPPGCSRATRELREGARCGAHGAVGGMGLGGNY